MTTGPLATRAALEPRRGGISDAEIKRHLRRAHELRAQAFHEAFHDAARSLARGLGRIWAGLGRGLSRRLDGLRHTALWRAPGSGNCLKG